LREHCVSIAPDGVELDAEPEDNEMEYNEMEWKGCKDMDTADGVVAPGGGRTIQVGPHQLQVKAGRETGHTLVGVFESAMPPGGGFPFAHVHDAYEEVFYVLEGEIEYRLGAVWTAAPVGTTICVPRGAVHAFRNRGPRPARHLVVHAPVDALDAVEEVVRTGQGQWAGILARHHSRLVGD
jgi:uncharacterized cupin superfamily protein